MSVLNVVEFEDLARGRNGELVPAGNGAVNAEDITASGTSASGTAFTEKTRFVRLCADIDVYVTFAPSPTAAAGDIYLPAGIPDYFGVVRGQKVAVILK